MHLLRDTEHLRGVAGEEWLKLDLEPRYYINDRTPTMVNSSYLAVGSASWSHISPNNMRVLCEFNAIVEARSGTVKR